MNKAEQDCLILLRLSFVACSPGLHRHMVAGGVVMSQTSLFTHFHSLTHSPTHSLAPQLNVRHCVWGVKWGASGPKHFLLVVSDELGMDLIRPLGR